MERNFLQQLLHDGWRIGAMLVLAMVIIGMSPHVAAWVGNPYLATYGNWMAFLFFGLAASHVARKLMAPESSLSEHLERARNGCKANALAAIVHALIILAFVLASRPLAAAELPANAVRYLPVLQAEQQAWWPELQMPSLLGAQVEQENPRWNTRACLKTSREQGCGLGQITRTARFDALAELVARHPQALAGWAWDQPTLYDPALQLRALVLKDRDNARAVRGAADQYNQVLMAFYAYNAGPGNLASDRMACRATRGCDPGRWFGHVEKTCYRKAVTVAGYGGRSFVEISHEYVRNIALVRRPRYLAMDA